MMRILMCLVGLFMATVAWGVEVDEVLDDPALESRAREISQHLRCVVCRSESIDESNAGIAKDLRILVRERLSAGDSDAEVMAFVTDRYGEYVLLKPTTKGANLLLWLAGPLLLILFAGIAVLWVRARTRASGPVPLTADEEARLKELTRAP